MHYEINGLRSIEPLALKGGAWDPASPAPRDLRADMPGGQPRVLAAPSRLVSATRVAFRRDALAFVEQSAHEGREAVDLDLGQTTEVDASGLGILVLIQRRARTHGLPTRLIHAREQARRLLTLTRLDYLFEFVD